jgi:hypothetical protein
MPGFRCFARRAALARVLREVHFCSQAHFFISPCQRPVCCGHSREITEGRSWFSNHSACVVNDRRDLLAARVFASNVRHTCRYPSALGA